MSSGTPNQYPQGFYQNGPHNKPSRRWLPWVIVAAVVVVIGAGAGIFFAVSGGDGSGDGAGAASTTSESSRPSNSTGPKKPDNLQFCSTERPMDLCLPGVTLDSAQQSMQSLGATCERKDDVLTPLECRLNSGPFDHVSLSFDTSVSEKNNVNRVLIIGASSGSGPHAAGEQQSVQLLKSALPKVLPVLLTQSPELPGQMSDWLNQNMGNCSPNINDYALVGNYRLSCFNPGSVGVSSDSGPVTSWTAMLSLSAGRATR